MRFGVDVHFAVKDVEAVAAKKAGKRRPLSAPTNTTTTAAARTVTALKQPKTVSMQTHMKSEHISLIEQYKPQLGRKQQFSGAPLLPVHAARGTNKALKEEESDPIEPGPMKLPSKYPIKITSSVSSSLSNKTRIDPKTKRTEDHSSSSSAAAVRWDINVICEDRDLLLLAQDCKISEYNLKHHILLSSQVKPEARLIASDRRVELRDKRLGVGRERIEHFSVGKAINDPMPFYPFLHEGTGIHEVKWCQDMTIPDEEEIAHEQWSKPQLSLQNSRSRRSFHKQFRVPAGDASPPTASIEVQHCLDRSIMSSYSKAALLDTGLKSSRR